MLENRARHCQPPDDPQVTLNHRALTKAAHTRVMLQPSPHMAFHLVTTGCLARGLASIWPCRQGPRHRGIGP